MTYCLGILLERGLLLASDSRTNAGVDQIATVSKLSVFATPGERLMTILSAGNLATTQAVISALRQAYGTGETHRDIATSTSLFDAAQKIGDCLRDVLAREASFVHPYGDPSASFLLGGQILGEERRLFQIYSAGNFMEASERTPFLQIGETKYGKPILDRLLRFDTSLEEAAKLTLLSFDATMRSNLSVGAPIDLLLYENGSLEARRMRSFDEGDPYLAGLRQGYAAGLTTLVEALPLPDM
ncbi:peptidase [Pannonibacter sp. SL95]|jgi:putative proteasome-type protease|uniref:peptidase n=1 Tax=Pannonibacter sp. SL95 TaxID=2995153 RepID=UPI0022744CFD|nr:peptidase [Pannonibacter sp. SL95]MCY1705759.1 peptidase [Pannonibacter sp. SL95]